MHGTVVCKQQNVSASHKNGGIQQYPYKFGENVSDHLCLFFTCIVFHVFEILFHLFSNHDQHKWEREEITTLYSYLTDTWQTICQFRQVNATVHSNNIRLLMILFFSERNIPGTMCLKNMNPDWHAKQHFKEQYVSYNYTPSKKAIFWNQKKWAIMH